MKPEAQRIAIAEVCSFKWPGLRKRKDTIGWILGGVYYPRLPDYPSDLNAMHEAEKMLTEEQHGAYITTLHETYSSVGFLWERAGWQLVHATAAQRAEAFLKTLGKWDARCPLT